MRILAFLLCLVWCDGWAATTRFATPSGGAASGSCTITTPCTLDRLRQLNTGAGDIGYLLPGRYSEGINTGADPGLTGAKFECYGQVGDCILAGFAQGSSDRVVMMDSSNYTLSKMLVIVPALGASGSGSRYGVRMEATGSGNQVLDSIFYAETETDPTNLTDLQWAIQARGTNFKVNRNSIHHVEVGVNANSDSGAPTGEILDNTIWDLSQGDEEDADCINYGSIPADSAYELVIQGNDCSGFRDDGIDFIGASHIYVQDNWIHDPAVSSTANSGMKVGGNKSGLGPSMGNVVRRNFVDVRGGNGATGTYPIVSPGLSAGYIYSNILVGDLVRPCIEISAWTLSPFGGGDGNHVENNIAINCTIGLYIRTAATNTVAANNIFAGSSSDINVETGTTMLGFTNRLAGTGAKAGNGTYTPTGDTTGAVTSWVGGLFPKTVSGFRLTPDSSFKCAGTNMGRRTDALGRGFEPNCTPIGAMVYGRGDLRATPLSPRP